MISYDVYAEFRNSQGLKDSDVARIAQIPQSTFSDWKKGKSKPKAEKMDKIRKALNMPVKYLLENSDNISETAVDLSVMAINDYLETEIKKLSGLSLEAFELAKEFDLLKAEDKRMIAEMITFLKSKKQDN